MALIVLILEPVERLRTQAVEAAARRARTLGLGHVHQFNRPPYAAVVGVPSPEALSMHEADDTTSFIAGYALNQKRKHHTAQTLAEAWASESPIPHQPDGYFCGSVIRKDGTLITGVDPLGTYPLFYTTLSSGTVLIASAPGFLTCHPGFTPTLDHQGMIGLLLANGLLFNQSLVDGVRQLPPATLLMVDARGVQLMRTAPPAPPPVVRDYREALEWTEALWREAVSTHTPPGNRPVDCLLSGGRDSRMLIATLREQGQAVRPLTFGETGDYEVIAARQVCRKLHLTEHQILDDPAVLDFTQAFRFLVQDAGLYSGASIGGLLIPSACRGQLRPHLWQGLLMDDVVGGYSHGFARNPDPHQTDAGGHEFFRKMNRWGFSAEVLKQLFRDPGLGDQAVHLSRAFINQFTLEGLSLDEAAFRRKLENRARYHLGASLWTLSFHAWPITPVCDQRLLYLSQSIPFEWIGNRRLQTDLIGRIHPGMLTIPNDANVHRFRPVRHAWLWPEWRRRRAASGQPLRYHRLFSPTHPGWTAIREEAEASRDALADLFQMDVLERYWPRFPKVPATETPFAPLAGYRNLMALAIWLGRQSPTSSP
ncbi:MAG: 7-cyano-7-deazaguanine synthase [Verrucomicrobia bacterium]|nr:7-cyano-7-deazaguanine synthase [Kiritimatiellia bacterium]MCB1100901.1 7-cyano-7-deazaguanine synthase [Kiritimatiellia bacterium]MCP5489362.1 7-cyano-7-deazaguanine synthase [Verrucomicrobiota bacterium]